MAHILHVLSQRPMLTGSGVSLDALVREADLAGWDQEVVVGIPTGTDPQVGGLDTEKIHAVRFASAETGSSPDLDFPVPGMSDVMPYSSSVWAGLSPRQLVEYRRVWTARLENLARTFRPDLVHTNHLWLVSTLVRRVFSDIPVVLTCHATGLRQLELCPHLAEEVIAGCRDVDHFCVLYDHHQKRLASTLGIPTERITVTGAGFRNDVFRPGPSSERNPHSVVYVGKYSAAKGVPWLLDAVQELARLRPGLRLHVAGSGAGPEADALAKRMDALGPLVVRHGQLSQPQLADLLRRCAVCVLPSFYEGVPLVLAEAAACGCRIVATDLPGVRQQLVPVLGPLLESVPLPRLENVDRPAAADLPRFISDLRVALTRSLDANPADAPDLSHFTWSGVATRIQDIWSRLLNP